MRRAAVALIAAAALACGFAARAEEGPKAKAAAATGEAKGDAASPDDGKADGKGEYVFLTGMDFSYWAAKGAQTIWGPGVMVGFVLVPRHLEMGFTLGAMLGGHQYTIPFEMAFTIPFYVKPWFAPFLKFGPTVITDDLQQEKTYDFAVSMSAGIELLPLGFDWGIYLCGDYNVRTAQDVRHQGGFTIGFHYRT
jgi:hypothetical protein